MKLPKISQRRVIRITIGFASGFFVAAMAPMLEDKIQSFRPQFVVSLETHPVVGFILFPPLFGALGAISMSESKPEQRKLLEEPKQ